MSFDIGQLQIQLFMAQERLSLLEAELKSKQKIIDRLMAVQSIRSQPQSPVKFPLQLSSVSPDRLSVFFQNTPDESQQNTDTTHISVTPMSSMIQKADISISG